MHHAIKTENLTKIYKPSGGFFFFLRKSTKITHARALDNVNLTVERGNTFGLLGPNGAGKTTLVKLLSTLVLPTSGTATVNGFDILEEPERVRGSIGLVTSDERSFYWRLSGRRNLQFFAELQNLSGRQAGKSIDQLVDLFSLKEFANERFDRYPSGIRQRFSIARGLLHDPQVLFLDEPTKSLDPSSARELRTSIKNLAQENRHTIVLITQQIEDAEILCDRIGIIDRGKIERTGSVDDLRRTVSPQEKYILTLKNFSLSCRNEIERIDGITQVSHREQPEKRVTLEILMVKGEDTLPRLLATLMESRVEIESVASGKIPLEEVVRELTTHK
jgi:ABC-2 type transport system ATP-binding protein